MRDRQSKNSATQGRSELSGLVRLLRWPEKPGNHMNPWYVILWKAVFWPFMVFGFAVSFVAILCAHGPREASRWWDNAT